jgi:RNA polymerase sigma-70 factor (ECF subfamily)
MSMTLPNSQPPKTDLELLHQTAQGLTSALGEIYDRYSKLVYNYLLRLIHEAAVAEELLQEVFLAVWYGAGQFRGGSTVKTWIFRIAHNQAVSWLRRHRSLSGPYQEETDILDGIPAGSLTPEEQFFSNWRIDQIIAALDQLTEAHRAVIELVFVHDFSHAEIAAIMDCPTGTVKSRISYALRHLKGILRGMDIKT